MNGHGAARRAAKKGTDMADTRRCIGSTRYGIEAHEAPIADFPKQPSQKDGLGRMCKPHWNQYTAGLARDRKARLAAGDYLPRDINKRPRAETIEAKVTPRRAPRDEVGAKSHAQA